MKKIIFTIALLISIIFGSCTAQNQNKLTESQFRELVKTIKAELPEKVEEGIIWTDVKYEEPRTLNYFMKLDAENTAIMKSELKEMTNTEIKEALGKGFEEMLTTFDCAGKLTFIYSDGTTASYVIKP